MSKNIPVFGVRVPVCKQNYYPKNQRPLNATIVLADTMKDLVVGHNAAKSVALQGTLKINMFHVPREQNLNIHQSVPTATGHMQLTP